MSRAKSKMAQARLKALAARRNEEIGAKAVRELQAKQAEKPKRKRLISSRVMELSRQLKNEAAVAARSLAMKAIAAYEPPPGVVPKQQLKAAMALDSTPYDMINAQGMFYGIAFPGYPYLAQLTQQPEYRKMTETIAKEMVRKWGRVKASGDDDKSEKVKQIEAELKRLKARRAFEKAAEHDGFFGRGQIYLDVKTPSGRDPREVSGELEAALFLDPKKIAKGSLRAIRNIEPVWTYPSAYNTRTPLAADYYKPSSWYVMGETVHSSRLMMFISRPVPDLLKAAYNFGGLSLSQIAQPYVNNWLRTRDSVGDMVHSFSISGVATNMSAVLQGETADDLFDRAELFNNMRDNRGLFMLDKDAEEFFQFNTPLSGLDALQAQAQEQLCAVSNIPLVKYTGITPSGLNATSDGEIRVFYDFIHSMQNDLFSPNMEHLLKVVQLSLFGEIDDDIEFCWEPLYQLDDLQKATKRKTDADTDAVLIGAGVISPEQSLQRVANDVESPYHGLDVEEVMAEVEERELQQQEQALLEGGGKQAERAENDA